MVGVRRFRKVCFLLLDSFSVLNEIELHKHITDLQIFRLHDDDGESLGAGQEVEGNQELRPVLMRSLRLDDVAPNFVGLGEVDVSYQHLQLA